jgi:pyruvate dehydrogenase E2 component (dihydrolipoamide acetyltransferase)
VTRQLVDDLLRYKRLDGVEEALSALLGTLLDGDRQAIDTPSLMEGVEVPVTIVWGAADRILPPPDGTGERVDAGPMLHMEAANDVVRVLRAHLELLVARQ